MGPLSADFKRLAVAAVLDAISPGTSRSVVVAGFAFLSAILCLAGIGFLMIAIYNMLVTQYGTQNAALYMSMIVILTSAILASTAYFIMLARQRQMKSYHAALMENIHATIDALTRELEEPIRENPKTAAITAGLAGFAAGRKLF